MAMAAQEDANAAPLPASSPPSAPPPSPAEMDLPARGSSAASF